MSVVYYDVLILMRDGAWGVRYSKLSLSTARSYAQEMMDPQEYSKRKPFPRERIKIKRHDPAYDFVEIHPERRVRDMYPKRLADSDKQQKEWDAKADQACRPISEVLDVVAEMLGAIDPDELPMKEKEDRPF